MKRCYLAYCFYMATGIFSLSWAAPGDDYNRAHEVVAGMTGALLGNLDKNIDAYKRDDERLFALVESIIVPAVDLEGMNKVVLGRHAKSMSARQQLDFQLAFKSMLIKSYSKTLLLLSGIQIGFLSPESPPENNKYQLVKTEVITTDGKSPVRVDYVVFSEDRERWLILDLVVDGLSLLKQFREAYSSEIDEHGVDALIERLRGIEL